MSLYLLLIGSVGCFTFFVIAIRKVTIYNERGIMTVSDPTNPRERIIFWSNDDYIRKSHFWGWISVGSLMATIAMVFMLSNLLFGPPALEQQIFNQLGK